MSYKPDTDDDDDDARGRHVGALSLKDLLTLVSVVVTLTFAWGVFGTRLTLAEKLISQQGIALDKASDSADQLNRRISLLEQQQQSDDFMIDQLYESVHLPIPKRRVPYQ